MFVDSQDYSTWNALNKQTGGVIKPISGIKSSWITTCWCVSALINICVWGFLQRKPFPPIFFFKNTSCLISDFFYFYLKKGLLLWRCKQMEKMPAKSWVGMLFVCKRWNFVFAVISFFRSKIFYMLLPFRNTFLVEISFHVKIAAWQIFWLVIVDVSSSLSF